MAGRKIGFCTCQLRLDERALGRHSEAFGGGESALPAPRGGGRVSALQML
jgi:hypothetical protein